MQTNAVQTKTIRYNVGEQEFVGHLAWDDAVSGKRPGVLVVHEWWGLNDFARGRANELAKLGYVAFACDMFGGGKVAKRPDEAGQLIKQLIENFPEWQKRASAALDVLKQQPSVRCEPTGGHRLLLRRFNGPRAGVLRGRPGGRRHVPRQTAAPSAEQARAIKASIVICHGALDSFTSDETMAKFRQVLEEAHVDYEIDYYAGAKHGFAVPEADKRGMPALGYNKKADERSWHRMLALFEEKFSAKVA